MYLVQNKHAQMCAGGLEMEEASGEGMRPPCYPSAEEMCSACVVAAPCSLCLVRCSWRAWVMRATTVSSFAAGRKAGLIQAHVTSSSAHYHLACGCLLLFVFGWKAAPRRFNFSLSTQKIQLTVVCYLSMSMMYLMWNQWSWSLSVRQCHWE